MEEDTKESIGGGEKEIALVMRVEGNIGISDIVIGARIQKEDILKEIGSPAQNQATISNLVK